VANTFSNPLMPNVPNFFAPWTYDEILITVPAQQHTPVARPKSLLTGKDVKVE
jgi:nitrate reductase / nitrite oxidoreductase, beta subunit